MSLEEVRNEERLNSDTLEDVVYQMLEYIKSDDARQLKRADKKIYVSTLERKFSDFQDRYPKLFQMVMIEEENFDLQKFTWMLNLLDQRNEGRIAPDVSDKKMVFREFNEHVKDKIDWEKEKANFAQHQQYIDQDLDEVTGRHKVRE
jgi:hypothetical protein